MAYFLPWSLNDSFVTNDPSKFNGLEFGDLLLGSFGT